VGSFDRPQNDNSVVNTGIGFASLCLLTYVWRQLVQLRLPACWLAAWDSLRARPLCLSGLLLRIKPKSVVFYCQ